MGNTEGNYPDSEAFQFQPASNTQLQSGDTITLSLPHPAETYSPSGSVLPAAQVADNGPSEQTGSTVSTYFGPVAFNGGEVADVEVNLPGFGAGETVRLDAFNPYDPPSVNKRSGRKRVGQHVGEHQRLRFHQRQF